MWFFSSLTLINNQNPIYPISVARQKLSRLIDQINRAKTIFVTKQGRIKAALVDFDYLQKMQKDLSSLYKKTYIDKKLLSKTRLFSDKEIREWLKEDSL